MLKRTEASVKYSRTIQVRPYEPATVELDTTITNDDGITFEDIDAEYKSLQQFVDRIVEAKVNSEKPY